MLKGPYPNNSERSTVCLEGGMQIDVQSRNYEPIRLFIEEF